MEDKEIIELDGNSFLVVDRINYKGSTYLYVVSTKGKREFSILREYDEDNTTYVESVLDEKLVKEILTEIANLS